MKFVIVDGGKTAINVNEIARISILDNYGVSYELVGKDKTNSCGGCMVCRGNKERSQVVFDELLEFMASRSDGVYNAHSRMTEMQKSGIYK